MVHTLWNREGAVYAIIRCEVEVAREYQVELAGETARFGSELGSVELGSPPRFECGGDPPSGAHAPTLSPMLVTYIQQADHDDRMVRPKSD